MYTEITSYELIQPGLAWTWPRLRSEERWQSLHDGDLGVLWEGVIPSVDNGLSILGINAAGGIQDGVIRSNWFRVISDFYTDAMHGENPTIASGAAARDGFLRAYSEAVLREVERATRFYTIKGRGVLLVDSRGVRAVDPSVYFPVTNPGDSGDVIGHILAYPYVERPEGRAPQDYEAPNRMRFVLWSPTLEVNSTSTWFYQGGILGQMISEEAADVAGIFVWGRGPEDAMYTQVVSPVREAMMRQTIINRILNRHGQPHLVVPDSLVDDLTLNPTGMTLPEDTANKGVTRYLTHDGAMASQMDQLNHLMETIHILAGIPPVVFGVGAGRGESGQARDRLMFSALARVRRIRRDIEGILPAVFDALGAPAGDTSVSWIVNPFSTQQERTDSILAQVAAGVLSADEAAERLGNRPPGAPAAPPRMAPAADRPTPPATMNGLSGTAAALSGRR